MTPEQIEEKIRYVDSLLEKSPPGVLEERAGRIRELTREFHIRMNMIQEVIQKIETSLQEGGVGVEACVSRLSGLFSYSMSPNRKFRLGYHAFDPENDSYADPISWQNLPKDQKIELFEVLPDLLGLIEGRIQQQLTRIRDIQKKIMEDCKTWDRPA